MTAAYGVLTDATSWDEYDAKFKTVNSRAMAMRRMD